MWDLHLKASIACLLPSIPITTVRSLSAISLDVCTECMRREGAQTAEETAYYSFFIILLSSNTAQCTACLRHHTYTYIIRMYTCTQTQSALPARWFWYDVLKGISIGFFLLRFYYFFFYLKAIQTKVVYLYRLYRDKWGYFHLAVNVESFSFCYSVT